MSLTIFLGQIFGLYLFITSLVMLIQHKFIKKVMAEIVKSASTLFLIGIMTLILGIICVIIHNIWVPGWEVIITIIAWLIFLKGLFLLFLPKTADCCIKSVLKKHKCDLYKHLKWFNIVCLILGAYLIYMTFFKLPLDFMINF